MWIRLIRANAAIRRELDAELAAEHGLTASEYEVLLRLSHANDDGGMRRVDLANQLLLSPSGITRMLDRLGKAGYVTKGSCNTDARVTYAVLTDAGLAKLEEATDAHFAAVARVFGDRFNDEDLATLTDLLSRLPGGDSDDCFAD